VSVVPENLELLVRKLNGLTPDDIAIRSLTTVDDAFDPRRHAKSRLYEYRILAARTPSAFWYRYAWFHPVPLDVDAMVAAAAMLVGEHDFEGFRAADADPVLSTVRRVHTSEIVRDGELLVYRIEATAFLKHMVRNIVGTLAEIGRGERPVAVMGEIVASRDRRNAGPTAPAHGLTLVAVRY
jgi:tRNA pseudouridine38-40 synthase